MHMADALVSPVVAGTLYSCSAIAAGVSVKKLHLELDQKKVPLMGIMGAFVFSAQMINFTIPGTGSSGHLCGGILLSALLGPYAGFLAMISVLLIQCVMFADGGLLALGCNIWNMAFYSCFMGALCIWKPMMKNGITKKKVFVASVVGSIVTLQFGSFSVALETLFSGVSELTFSSFVAVMQPIHVAIGLVEGIITASVLCFIYEARPELLWESNRSEKKRKQYSMKKVLVVLGIVSVLVGGALSLVASSSPDGLEWSIGKVTGKEELTSKSKIHNEMKKVQDKTAYMKDYSFKEGETPVGTSFSGIFGGFLVLGVLLTIGSIVKYRRKNVSNEEFE